MFLTVLRVGLTIRQISLNVKGLRGKRPTKVKNEETGACETQNDCKNPSQILEFT
jgi:hypothetical protein